MSSRADDATVEQFRGEAASPVVPAVRRSLDPQERMIWRARRRAIIEPGELLAPPEVAEPAKRAEEEPQCVSK